jgi:hypothetical protein
MVGPVITPSATKPRRSASCRGSQRSTTGGARAFRNLAGSDLASLRRPSAVRDGDEYVVNGQKTWTTLAQHADWIFCLVRTDPDVKKQVGISFLLIDMKTPGITVRPIQTIDGGNEVNEVFFTMSGFRSKISSARKTRAGIMPSSCSATNASTSPGSVFPRNASAGSRNWQRRSGSAAAPMIEDQPVP